MSRCAAALAAALAATIWVGATATAAAQTPATPAINKTTPPSVAHEPLFAGIVERASKLKAETAAYEKDSPGVDFDHLPGADVFKTDIGQLSSLDMQGHVTLVQRGYSDDLKCILKGISQDLPVKMKALETAADPTARHAALEDMFYLLRDNVETITAPPRPSA